MADLYLNLRKIYFDAIKRGDKTEEYRLYNDYWKKKLSNKVYDNIIVKMGYPKNNEVDKILKFKWNGYYTKFIAHNEFGNKPVKVFAIKLNNNTGGNKMRNIDVKNKTKQEIIDEVKKVISEDGRIPKATYIRLLLEDPTIVMTAVTGVKYPAAVLEGILFPKGIFDINKWDKLYATATEEYYPGSDSVLMSNIINAAEDTVYFANILTYISVDVEDDQYKKILQQCSDILPVKYMAAITEELELRNREDEDVSEEDIEEDTEVKDKE